MGINSSVLAAVVWSVALASTGLAGSPDVSTEVVRGLVAERVDRYLVWAEQFGFSGVALLAMDGEILLHKPYGLADRDRKIPNRLDTVFSFGSIAKQFTAAAVMKLEQQGKLRTDDAIAQYFDSVPPDKRAITIHQLLTHTSGLADYHGIHDFQKMDRDTAVRVILGKPLLSRPGTEFAYSNSGYTLAAAIIERVTGRPFVDFMQREIFKPAGMSQTGFMGDDLWERSRSAHIYRGSRDNGPPRDKPGPFWVLLGNGGVVSTVGQMYLWDRALRGDAVLGDAAKQKIFTPYMNEYGYGWDVLRTDRGTLMHSHNGGSALGLSAEFQRYVDEDGAFILASNASIGDALAIDYVVAPLSRLIFQPGPELPAPPRLVPSAGKSAQYEGRYDLPGGDHFVVYVDGGQLFFAAVGQDALAAVDSRARAHARDADKLNARAAQIISGVFGGDLRPLTLAFTETDEPVASRALRWSKLLKSSPRNHGDFTKSEILGTTDLGRAGKAELVTWIRLHFSRGTRVCRLHWNDGKLQGLGGDALAYPFYGPLRFTPDGHGMVFHFSTESAIKIQFDGDPSAAITALSIEVDSKRIRGQKATPGA